MAIVAGTYGGNAGQPQGNATWSLFLQCDGRVTCDYTISVGVLGDPLPGVPKDYLAEWRCNAAGQASALSHLECP
jgi:hypothetical protein